METLQKTFKCGYVTIVGRPNVGKSTLLNTLCGQSLAAVSPKPQTTRQRITGIINVDNAQIIFLDTPGFHKSEKELNKILLESIDETIMDTDLFCLVVEPRHDDLDLEIFTKIKNKKVIIVVNKADKITKTKRESVRKELGLTFGIKEIVFICALKNSGVDNLIGRIVDFLPNSPAFYPDDVASTLNMRFLCAELIRQEVFNQMRDEIPYSSTVKVEKFNESKKPVVITASIIVERDSQKAMIIGKKGSKIKEIGIKSRKLIENMLGEKVFLELFVKISKNWTKDGKKIKDFLNTY